MLKMSSNSHIEASMSFFLNQKKAIWIFNLFARREHWVFLKMRYSTFSFSRNNAGLLIKKKKEKKKKKIKRIKVACIHGLVNIKEDWLDLGIRTESPSSYDIVVSLLCYEAL